MKQTAIDWYIQQMGNLKDAWIMYSTEEMIIHLNKLKEQAKQMEKEQMIEFAEDYIDYHCYADFDNQITYDKTATEYFNELYKGGNDD